MPNKKLEPHEQYRQDHLWIAENRDRLRLNHKSYIAVVNKKVVCEADTFRGLVLEMDRCGIDGALPEVCVEKLPNVSRGKGRPRASERFTTIGGGGIYLKRGAEWVHVEDMNLRSRSE